MRRCRSANVNNLCRNLCATCNMDFDGSPSAAGDVHSCIQLSFDLDGNFTFVYYLLSEREMVKAVPGNDITAVAGRYNL